MSMFRTIPIGLVFSLACVVTAQAQGPALSAPTCHPRDVWVSMLADGYKERLVGKGLVGNGSGTVIELFTTRVGGTFTLLATGPKTDPATGRAFLQSCMIASGDHWQIIDPPPGDPS